jgi:hypothetical protein
MCYCLEVSILLVEKTSAYGFSRRLVTFVICRAIHFSGEGRRLCQHQIQTTVYVDSAQQ